MMVVRPGSPLVDCHAHLDDPAFDADREAVIARSREAGVSFIVTAGSDLDSSQFSVAIAEEHPGVYAAVGFHPHEAARMQEGDLARLCDLSQHPRVVAIGEIGLDFYRNLSPKESQVQVFCQQLELARQRRLPVVVHSRQAEQETEAILTSWAEACRQEGRDGPLGMMHCFAGDAALAERYTALGFLISLAGTVTFRGNPRAQEVVSQLPLEWLLVETDSPYLTPHPYRGRRNEPARLALTVEAIAGLRQAAPETIAARATENALRLFSLAERDT